MDGIKYTLLTDGRSDKTLMNIIKWSFDNLYPRLSTNGSYADLGLYLKNSLPAGDVDKRIKIAEKFYPFDILFYHRDAEKFDKNIIKKRKDEIFSKIDEQYKSKIVCIVPVTMMETWLLINQEAIKKAAGNRNYSGIINLPATSRLESIKDPKKELYQTLRTTSGLKGRQLKMFNERQAVHLIAENINDFSPLRELSAFREFEHDLKKAVNLLAERHNLVFEELVKSG